MDAELFFKRESLFNHYVAAHNRGDPLQTTHWGRLKESQGWSYYPLAVQEQGQIRGSALILIKKLPLWRTAVAYSPRGPLFSSAEALTILLQEGLKLSRSLGALVWKMDPPLDKADPLWSAAAKQHKLRLVDTGLDFQGVQPKFVMTLDLRPPSAVLLAQMKSKTRYNIRYAGRQDVRVFRATKEQHLSPFYSLLAETARRDRFRIRALSYYQAMWKQLMEEKLAHLFLAYRGQTALAGAILFCLGKRAWYVYGASSNENRNLQASHLIQWEMIQYSKSLGCEIYDFRGVSGDLNPQHPLYGLYRFKEGFGARLVQYVGEFDLPTSKGGYALWLAGQKVQDLWGKVKDRS